METSSNFFNKCLLALEEDHSRRRKLDLFDEPLIVLDPLSSKEELTPWTEIHPKYNYKIERLIKFKQKYNQ